MTILDRISEFLMAGNNEKVFELTSQAIDQKITTKEILDRGLIAGMDIVGEKFKNHDIFLPEVLMAARAMYAGMDLLKPLLIKEGIPSIGTVAIGTVKGDLHDIGKNLVGIMLKGAGFEVIDLGKDVPPDKFVEVAKHQQVDVIGMSALLTTTMPVMGSVIDLIKETGLNGTVKTIVGGAPTSEQFAADIGADGYAYDAASAVDCVKKLIGI